MTDGRQLLRTSYMATHTEEHLDFVLSAFEAVSKQVSLLAKGNFRRGARGALSL